MGWLTQLVMDWGGPGRVNFQLIWIKIFWAEAWEFKGVESTREWRSPKCKRDPESSNHPKRVNPIQSKSKNHIPQISPKFEFGKAPSANTSHPNPAVHPNLKSHSLSLAFFLFLSMCLWHWWRNWCEVWSVRKEKEGSECRRRRRRRRRRSRWCRSSRGRGG